jgi:hypothetical protein
MLNASSDMSEQSFLVRFIRGMKNCCWCFRKWRATEKRRMLIEKLEGVTD